ncbi:MAG: undecaprenyl/decaprenyl-phosphate alpha-N-acetylglucosaminyl 1-phosphate transferase [Chitinophagales bacterium]|nr:undecaprenyl/decaprenyl-phosphate alpha-N-acetylglucosaminyl 1-phosphate transferase [Chitinophagales bacterium]
MLSVIAASINAFLITFFVIPSIISVAEIKHLYDTPGQRKSHHSKIPTLGGIGIFAGFLISVCLYANFAITPKLQFIMAAFCLVFILGAKDDIVELTAYKKFIGQVAAAFIIAYFGDIRITSLYGVFNISHLNYFVSIALTMFVIILIVNSFNLIDGINCLAAFSGVIIASAFGGWFYLNDYNDFAILASAIVGSLFAFIKYNFTPAKIFMGDSGSLTIGILSSILAIEFIEKSEIIHLQNIGGHFWITAAPGMAVAILIIPLFDTLRAFSLRILNGKSPFEADRNHIHHKLIDIGLSHVQASVLLSIVNIGFIVFGYYLQFLGNLWMMVALLAVAIMLSIVLFSIKSLPNNKSIDENQDAKDNIRPITGIKLG